MDDGSRAPAVTGIASLAFDCREPRAVAAFWQALLGGAVHTDDEGDCRLRTGSGVVLDFLRVPEGKTVKNRLHLDLRTSDLSQAVEQALALGATRADDVFAGGWWQVLRDPEGNELCLLGDPPPGASGLFAAE